jgi:hypothetical protein
LENLAVELLDPAPAASAAPTSFPIREFRLFRGSKNFFALFARSSLSRCPLRLCGCLVPVSAFPLSAFVSLPLCAKKIVSPAFSTLSPLTNENKQLSAIQLLTKGI